MSATILSAFYEIDMLCKQEKTLNMNTIHLNSMLDKKAVGAPVSMSASNSAYATTFYRRNSASNLDSLTNGNKYLKENPNSSSSNTAIMNKENRFRERAYSENTERPHQQAAVAPLQKPGSQINSTRYKTELCRPFEESGSCKYGEKCQFAHGYHELRSLSRHPKYKTEPCRTFHTIGFCPYGPRCHFIHNADERRPAPTSNLNAPPEPRPSFVPPRPKLHHSLSFSGFSSHHGLDASLLESPTSRTPPPPSCSSASAGSFYEDALPPFPFSGQDLKALLTPLAIHTQAAYEPSYYGSFPGGACPPSPPYGLGHLQSLRRLSESPVFDSPPSPPDSLSDRESYASGSLSSSGSLSGSESPSLDAGRRLPIFSRLSISDD